MVVAFVHIIFGLCLALSMSSPKTKAEESKPTIEDKYEDHIESMYSKEVLNVSK